ncbi:MAG: phage protease [Planctomycetaceae bacterium]|nr:phage protease [Planctomycetaceae bacterium]
MQTYPILLHVLTGDPIRHDDVIDGKPFIVDLSTIRFSDNAILDYNHQEENIESYVGTSRNFRVTGEGLFADGEIIQVKDNDPAGLLIAKLASKKFHYGCSPRLELGPYTVLRSGETAIVNGAERNGPLHIFRNSLVQGVAVTPYPTDEGTSVTLLSATGIVLLASNNPIIKENIDMADDNTTPDTPESPTLKEPLLKELADLVGAEKALELFQSGEDLQVLLDGAAIAAKLGLTAPATDTASLSDETKTVEDDPEKEKAAQLSDEPNPGDDEEKKKTAELSALTKKVGSLEKQIVNLSAKLTAARASDGIESSVEKPKTVPTVYSMEAELQRREKILSGN